MGLRKILFVINPIAGGENKDAFRQNLTIFASQSQSIIEEYLTTGVNDEENIKLKIDEFNPNIAVAVGGDGTLLLVARCILKSNIVLGIVPFGSANGMATELQIPNDKDLALDIILHGKDILIDTLLIDKKYPCLHIGDIGFKKNCKTF